jgi:hypothetical protein
VEYIRLVYEGGVLRVEDVRRGCEGWVGNFSASYRNNEFRRVKARVSIAEYVSWQGLGGLLLSMSQACIMIVTCMHFDFCFC